MSQDAVGTTLGYIVHEQVTRTGPEIRLYRMNQQQTSTPTAWTSSVCCVCMPPGAVVRAAS